MTDRIYWYDRAGEFAHAFTVSHALTLCGRWRWSSMFGPGARRPPWVSTWDALAYCVECVERARG